MDNTQTINPQTSIGTIDDSTSIVQESVGGDVLRQYDGSLSVEQTGESQGLVEQFMPQSTSDYFVWMTVAFVVIVLVVWLVSRLIKESMEDDEEEIIAVDVSQAESKTKSVGRKVTSKKSSAKKRSAPNQRRKKTQQKKR